MAGSIEDNTALYKKKTYTYVPPAPPAELIESTSFTLDFATRKFIHIGIDPSSNFIIAVHILTSSRYIQVTPDYLNILFTYMSHILSFILDIPEKYKRVIFFEDEILKLSSMVYSGENVLVIEAKHREGCRILLNRTDLIQLQYLECSIDETLAWKEVFAAPLVIKQYKQIATYLDNKCAQLKLSSKNLDQLVIFIKNIRDDQVVKSVPNFTNQIQMYAALQLAESILNRQTQNIHESPTSSSGSLVLPSYSPVDEDDSTTNAFNQPDILAKAFDQIDGPSIPVDEIPQSVDENDGPDFFNRFYSPPSVSWTPPPAYIRHPAPSHKRSHPTFAEHPTPVRDVKPRLF